MNRIIGVTDLQRNFRAVFDEVARKGVPYVLTRGSRPEVAMIPYDDYLRYIELNEAGVLARFDQARERLARANVAFSDEEVEADLEEMFNSVVDLMNRNPRHKRRLSLERTAVKFIRQMVEEYIDGSNNLFVGNIRTLRNVIERAYERAQYQRVLASWRR